MVKHLRNLVDGTRFTQIIVATCAANIYSSTISIFTHVTKTI
jgi:hypothetical protein